MTNTRLWIVAGIALVVALFASYEALKGFTEPVFGSIGVKLAENYDPYIRYNGGYYSALPIQTTSTGTFVGLTNTGTWTQGTNGTAINRINQGACNVLAYANTIAASTTGQVDCSATGQFSTLTGVTSGDNVTAHATTTISCTTAGCMSIVASNASSTNGYVTLVLYNGTGGTFTWTGTASTSIQYFDIH